MTNYMFVMLCLVGLFLSLNAFLHTNLLGNPKFWLMQLFACCMIIAFDTYAHGMIWNFNHEATIGLYIFKTPVENILFGCSLIGINIVLFERDSRKP